jgi:Metallo-peptidase family M12B Reprolysin-like/FG-GAP-like repeat
MTKPISTTWIKPSNITSQLCGIRRESTLNDLAISRRFLTIFPLLIGLSFLGTSASYAAANDLFKPLPDQSGVVKASQRSDVRSAKKTLLDRIKEQPTTKSLTLMRIDVNALKGKSTRMMLSSARTLNFDKSNVEFQAPNSYTWFGSVPGLPGQATLVVRNGNITGTVRDNGDLYRIEPIGNGVHAVIKVDQSRFVDHPPVSKNMNQRSRIGQPPMFSSFGTIPIKMNNRSGIAKPPMSPFATKRSDGGIPVGIDVLVAYTPEARIAVGDMEAFIQLAVAETNKSYTDSGVNIKLTLVDSFEVDYSDAGKTIVNVLDDFPNMVGVQSRRDISGADLALIISSQADFCGVTRGPPFAAVSKNCATGYYSFGHEIGHMHGADHDIADNKSAGYAHGFINNSIKPNWRTIMTVENEKVCPTECKRLPFWSNPNIKYNGIPMGIEGESDNARVLNETAQTVAGFRTKKSKFDDILWQRSDGLVHYWSIQNGKRVGGFDIGDAPLVGRDWKLVGVGDLNGDGTDDILWQRYDGLVHYWSIKNGKRVDGIDIGDTPSRPFGSLGLLGRRDWKLVGVGDFNGDGTDDVLWQRKDGSVHYWPIQNGKRVGGFDIGDASGRKFGLPGRQDWRLVGVGDLNGDGTDDILWRHKNGLLHYWSIQNGKRIGGVDVGDAPRVGREWEVVGVGDLNGDKTDDLLWRRDDGLLHYWSIKDGKRLDGVDIEAGRPGPEWRLVGVGNLN